MEIVNELWKMGQGTQFVRTGRTIVIESCQIRKHCDCMPCASFSTVREAPEEQYPDIRSQSAFSDDSKNLLQAFRKLCSALRVRPISLLWTCMARERQRRESLAIRAWRNGTDRRREVFSVAGMNILRVKEWTMSYQMGLLEFPHALVGLPCVHILWFLTNLIWISEVPCENQQF